jgi:hypothetical protein
VAEAGHLISRQPEAAQMRFLFSVESGGRIMSENDFEKDLSNLDWQLRSAIARYCRKHPHGNADDVYRVIACTLADMLVADARENGRMISHDRFLEYITERVEEVLGSESDG